MLCTNKKICFKVMKIYVLYVDSYTQLVVKNEVGTTHIIEINTT